MAFVSTDQPAATTLFNRISTAFGNFQKSQLDNRMFRKTLNELSQLSDRELSDLGLSRSNLYEVAQNAVYNK